MRVLVTGGSGYLGGAIVRALATHGHDPIVFARHASAAGLPGRPVDGDVRDRAAVMRALDGADAVCHTAALVSVWRARPKDFDDVNIGGLETMLDACRILGLPRIVYTSSFLALPPAGAARPLEANDYQRTKVRALEVARAAASLPIVTLVPGVIYGPGHSTEGNLVGRLIRDRLGGRLPAIVGGDRLWSYAYIDDVAEAHVAALTREQAGGEYQLGGDNVPQLRIFEVLRDVCGAPLPRRLPAALATAAGGLEELRAWIFGTPPLLTRGVVEIFRHDWPLDSRRSQDELSYHVTPADEGLRATLAALR